MYKLKTFRASAAEQITSMSAETQRVKRRRGQLSPVTEGKAALSAILLAEMCFVSKLSKLNIGTEKLAVPAKGADNLTVRAVAARWIAFWALCTQSAFPERLNSEERERFARNLLQIRRDQKAFEFAILPVDTEPNWLNVIWSNDPGSNLQRDSLSIAINLKMLGEDMVQRAGPLVER